MRTRRSDHESLGSLLRGARERARLTQQELAERLGVEQATVSKYESGGRQVGVVEFLLICEATGADPFAILRKLRAASDASRPAFHARKPEGPPTGERFLGPRPDGE